MGYFIESLDYEEEHVLYLHLGRGEGGDTLGERGRRGVYVHLNARVFVAPCASLRRTLLQQRLATPLLVAVR